MNKRYLARQARDEARDRGDSFYFTGGECKRGHISKRYVSSGKCLECAEKVYLHTGREARRIYSKEVGNKSKKHIEKAYEWIVGKNKESIKTAHNYRGRWSMKDIGTILARSESGQYLLPATEVALLVGRSVRGVEKARGKFKEQSNSAISGNT